MSTSTSFNPENFKSIRLLNGYSFQDLSDRLLNDFSFKISRQALHKYEKGESTPDAGLLKIFAKIFNVSEFYFSKTNTLEIVDIKFRKLSRLPVKEETRIKQLTIDKLQKFIELEDIIFQSITFKNPLKGFQIKYTEDIENAVEVLRRHLNLGQDPIINVLGLLESIGIKVIEIESANEFDGLQASYNGDNPVVVINKTILKSADRIRFTALHELAHLCLEINHFEDKDQEKLCNRFASAMLIPAKVLYRKLGRERKSLSLLELGIIKKEYGISMQAIAYRAKDLEIITQTQFSRFFYMIHQLGYKVKEPVEYVGYERTNRFEQMLARCISEEIISIEKAANLYNVSEKEFRSRLANFEL